MKFSRPILMFVIIAILAIAIALFIPISSAERKGEDADPPEHGDWVIDSIGNYIGNETDWVEVIHGEPPTEIPHDDAVKLDGNITIKNGGELTLYNTTINMTDHNNFHIIIEENGTLIMEWGDDDNSTCKILNNNQSYIGFMEIKGNLSMNLSSISQVNNIFVNSSVPTLSLNVASFGLQQTFYIKDQNLTFEWADIFSETDMALSLYNTTIHWKGGTVNGLSNTTESTVLYLKDSEVVADRLWVTSGSDYNICLYLDNSAFTATNSWIGRANGAIALYATKNSYVNLSKTRVFSKGENLMECFGSQVIITDSNLGNYKYYQQKTFISGCFFEECDVLFDGVGLFRVEDHAIDARDSNLTMINSNLWNITQDAIHVRDTAIMLENVGIYNVQGDAIHLRYVEVADIINCTIDEDDPCYTNEFPFPPQYPGFGHGIMGHGIFAMDSHLNITGCSLAATEDHEIYLMDSTVNITDSTFKTPGNKETTKVHGIYMEDSTGIISNNSFNNAYRKGGFDLFGMETVPLNLTGFIEGNNFSDGRIFQQQFTLAVRVIDEFGSPVSDALVNLTDNNASNRKLSVSGIDGWISNPFTVPVYEIFRYTGHNNQTGEDFENFTNFSYNDHHLIVIKEYKAYNFNVSTELDVNITHTMTLNVRLNVSTPELSVKTAGIFPMVLKGGNIGITVVLKNLGERAVEDVNVSCYYALNDTQDWSWFGSDIVSVPDIFNGGNHSMYTTSFPVNAPLGVYNFKVVVDPENTIVERNETNNNYTIMDAFEVLTKPGIFIDHPIGGEIVNGTYPISGRAEHDCNNTIQEIELWIDGNKLTVTDTTPTPGIVLWGFNWNTTLYDPGTGKDKYPNGPHNIGVRCRNSNPSGYDTSDWCNITVTVVNVPVLHFQHPEEGEFVDQTEGLPLYKVEVKVESFHDLTGVKLRIDNGPSQGMTLMGNTFSYMLDTSKYGDGYHTLRYVGEYGYGEVSEAVTILLDSPNEDSLPTISASYELTDNGLTVQGTSSDDFMVEWVKLRLDDNPWIIVNQSGENFTRFDHFWSREALTPDTHSISIKAYDGFDSEDKIIWVPVGLLYDLTIKEIILPTDVTEDDWVNFTVVVENTGPYASPPVNLILRIGRIMRTEDGITIPANSRQDIEISWHASKGNHSISAEINPSQKNDETDPTNNVYTDGNLKVKEKKADGPSDGFDYSMIMIAAVIMIILGIAAGVSFLFGGKKKVE